jgi:hypothetical protein
MWGRNTMRNERGATIALVAVSLTALMGMGALAVDLSMLMKARGEAQRAADASALAGASAFLAQKPFDAVDSARTRAILQAGKNYVNGRMVDTLGQASTVTGTRYVTTSNELVVVVLPDSEKVRAIIRRTDIPTLFGRVLGFAGIAVSAKAAAEATNSGAGKCVKPFAIPDMWHDVDDDLNTNRLKDIGQGQGNNQGEDWEYDTGAGDSYVPYGSPTGTQTGLGSSWRNNYTNDGTRYWDDYGRPFMLKTSTPHLTVKSGFFYPWRPEGDRGGNDYRWNIANCNPTEVHLNTDVDYDSTSYDDESGNMIGPTKQGMMDLIAKDSLACWADAPDQNHVGYSRGMVMRRARKNGPCNVAYPDWESSPRVAMVPLFDPTQAAINGNMTLRFNNLALIFIEEQLNGKAAVMGRFLYFARGTEEDTNQGSLVKKLRLVE